MREQRPAKTRAQLEQEWEESLSWAIRDNPQWLKALKQLEGFNVDGKDQEEEPDEEDEDEADAIGHAIPRKRRGKRLGRKSRRDAEIE